MRLHPEPDPVIDAYKALTDDVRDVAGGRRFSKARPHLAFA